MGTISGLAAVTSTLRLGALVSPVTSRRSSLLAKTIVTADHIYGGGRIEVGMGAGWLEDEHSVYDVPFPPTSERLRILEEQGEIVRRRWTESHVTFTATAAGWRASVRCPSPWARPT